MQTTLEQATSIKALCKNIDKLTDNNCHTQAVLTLAEFIGGKFPAIVRGIELAHNAEGHMPMSLNKYRIEVLREMMQAIGLQYGEDVRKQIYSSF